MPFTNDRDKQLRSLKMLTRFIGGSDMDPTFYALGSLMRDSCNYLSKLSEEDPSYDALVDDEVDQIETILGLCFVAGQTAITSVVSGCKRIHLFAGRYFNSTNLSPVGSGNKSELMKRYEMVTAGAFTPVTAIDAFANYFKHCDEWGNWSDLTTLTGKAAETATIVHALGARSGSTGNLRTGFEAICGDTNYADVVRFGGWIEDWANKLRDDYQRAISAL
jgi:hypothetical protein